MRRWLTLCCGLLAVVFVAVAARFTHHSNQRARERDEFVLHLHAEGGPPCERRQPEIRSWYLQRLLNSERSYMRVLRSLVRLEIGRAPHTQPPVPLNETAAQRPRFLRPAGGETPLPPYARKPPELLLEGWQSALRHERPGRCLAVEMLTTTGERWMVATAPVFRLHKTLGHSVVTARPSGNRADGGV